LTIHQWRLCAKVHEPIGQSSPRIHFRQQFRDLHVRHQPVDMLGEFHGGRRRVLLEWCDPQLTGLDRDIGQRMAARLLGYLVHLFLKALRTLAQVGGEVGVNLQGK
jgi:hypothetical protein